MKHAQNFHSYCDFVSDTIAFESLWYYMWALMHTQQSPLNSVLEQKGRHACDYIISLIIILLFGFIMMFDTAMFLPSFDTDYIGWKHQA